MAVTNIQAWADSLELVRLPLIIAELDDLNDVQNTYNALLSAKIQEFSDKFAQHSARITASQARADDAKDTANSALTQIYQTGLDAQTYTDMRIQSLRDELNLSLNATQDYVDGDFASDITTQIDSRITTALALLEPIAAEVQSVRDAMLADLADIQAVTAEILYQGIPDQAVVINQVAEEIEVIKAQAALTLAGFEYDTLLEALDATQSKISESLVPLGVSSLQLPAAAWTINSASASFSAKNPVPSTWFILNDSTLGACAQLPLGTNQTIGQAYPVDFAADRVYQVRVRVRVTNSGSTNGVRLTLGVSTWASGVAAQLNVEKELTATAVPAGTTDRIYNCVFSGNLSKLQAQEYSVGLTAANTAVHLTGSATANKAFFHIRQNPGSGTNGQIRVALLEVKDITEAIDAVKVIKTQLQAELGTVTASLEQVSFAVADLNQSVSGITSRLASQSLPNLIGNPELTMPLADLWLPILGATLSIVTHGQTGPLNTKALRFTDAADDGAGFVALPYTSGNFTNRTLRFRGKARASANGVLLTASPDLWRLGAFYSSTPVQLLSLTTNFQPFDKLIKALAPSDLATEEVQLRFRHSGGPIGSWTEITDLEVYDVTESETAKAEIAALLAQSYYTKTETSGAIAEGITSFEAKYFVPTSGQMKATALTDYYTKATTDSAISSGISSYVAEFRDPLSNQIKAEALTSYFTKTETNSAVSTASTTLSTSIAAKGKTIYSTTAPAVADQLTQNLWIDLTGGNNVPKRWNGTAWVEVSDKTAAAAVQSAVTADLTTNYYTKSATDSALATATTSLNATISTAQATANGKGKVIFSLVAPTGADQVAQNLWINVTNGANTPNRWTGTAWVVVSDKAATDALAAANTVSSSLVNNYYTKTTADSAIAAQITSYNSTLVSPTGYAGLLSANLSQNYYTKTAVDSALSTATTTLSSATAAKGKVIYSSTTPVVADQLSQNMWIDLTGGTNIPKRWNGTAWVSISDGSPAASAVSTVNANLTTNYYTKTATDSAIASSATVLGTSISTAQATANGKGKVIFSLVAPLSTEQLTQNLWIDLTGGANTPKRWNGTAWAVVTDKAATDALTAASTVAASLVNNYYTKTAADSATAAQLTNYNSTLISPTGYAGLLSANLATNYYTKTATDTAISSASTVLSSATTAKGKIIYSATSPLAADQLTQNLWIDTNANNNTPKRWNGTAWIAVTNKVATDAAAAVVTTNAKLTTDYYTKTATDSAISAANLTLSAEITEVQKDVDAANLALPMDRWKILNGKTIVTLTDGVAGPTAMRIDGSAGYPNQGTFIEIDRTKTYRVIFWARPSADNTAGLLYFSLRQLFANGSVGPVNGGRNPYKPQARSPAQHITQFGNTWGKYTYDWTSTDWQVGVTKVLPEFLYNYPLGSAGYWDIQGFEIQDLTEVKAETGLISADLSNNYYTKTTANSAIAAADLFLKSTLEAATGSIGQAQTAAASAATLAGGKGKVLYQTAAPAVADQAAQNLWIDITGGANTPKRWNGTAWVAVTDKVATDAATAAAAAATSVASLSATLTSTYYTKTAADTAIAAADTILKTAIENPNGTSLGATVKTQANTIATLSGNAASLLSFRAQAGTAGAQLELVASSSPAGAVSQARIDADKIILDGTVVASHIAANSITVDRLVSGGGSNLLQNTDFGQGTQGWALTWQNGTVGAQSTFARREAGTSWAGTHNPTAMVFQNGTATDGNTDLSAVYQNTNGGIRAYSSSPVTAGRTYIFSARMSFHRCDVTMIIAWYDSAGTYLTETQQPYSVAVVQSGSSTNPDSWYRGFVKGVAPSTAAYAMTIFRKYGTLSGTSSYLFVNQPQFEVTHAGATQPAPYFSGYSTIIDGGNIRTGSITAASGAIGDLAVNTLQIAGQAVTVGTISAGGIYTLAPQDTGFRSITGVGITRTAGYGTLVTFNYAVSLAMDFEMYAIVNGNAWVNLTNQDSNNWTSASLWDGDTAGGYRTYHLYARAKYYSGYYETTIFGEVYRKPGYTPIRIASTSVEARQFKR